MIDRGASAIAVEQPAQRKAVEQAARRDRPERRERGAPIGQQLDQHAAGADRDERSELRIAHHAERELDAVRHHARDEDARAEPRGKIAPGARARQPRRARPRCTPPTSVLCRMPGCAVLSDDRIADAPRGGDGRVFAVDDGVCATTGMSYAASKREARRLVERPRRRCAARCAAAR